MLPEPLERVRSVLRRGGVLPPQPWGSTTASAAAPFGGRRAFEGDSVALVDPFALGGWLRIRPSALSRTYVGAAADLPRRMAAAHIAALFATGIILAVDAADAGRTDGPGIGIVIFVGFAVLRVGSVRRTLAISTLALDAVGTALLLAGTGAPASAYLPLVLAGAWWAAHVPRSRSGLAWAIAFVAAYGILVLPDAIRGSDAGPCPRGRLGRSYRGAPVGLVRPRRPPRDRAERGARPAPRRAQRSSRSATA